MTWARQPDDLQPHIDAVRAGITELAAATNTPADSSGRGEPMTDRPDHPWYVVLLAVVMGACGMIALVSLTAIVAWLAWHVVVP